MYIDERTNKQFQNKNKKSNKWIKNIEKSKQNNPMSHHFNSGSTEQNTIDWILPKM